MGHELFTNMREGNWLLEYHQVRLKFMESELGPVIDFLNDYLPHVKSLNPTFKPKYGSRILEKLYNAALYEILNRRMQDPFISGS
jgi:hypothetical protein